MPVTEEYYFMGFDAVYRLHSQIRKEYQASNQQEFSCTCVFPVTSLAYSYTL
jgi:hypothetical protein